MKPLEPYDIWFGRIRRNYLRLAFFEIVAVILLGLAAWVTYGHGRKAAGLWLLFAAVLSSAEVLHTTARLRYWMRFQSK